MRIVGGRRLVPVFLGALIVLIAACDSDGDSADSSESPAIIRATVIVPSGLPLVEGIPVVTVLGPPESDAGEVPLFSWEPVAGASRYTVAVLGPDAPFWAWQGEETEIYLGGLPFERPPGWAGPVILPGSCWSVMARGADGHIIAVSEFLPVSPAEPAGHSCVPGQGSSFDG
jgi:hypothetical protein